MKGAINNASDERLEAEVSFCEEMIWVFGGVLFVGLVMGGILVVLPPDPSTAWAMIAPLIAELCVIGGVGGELLFGRLGSRRQNELALRAKKKLIEANERIAALLVHTGELTRIMRPRTLWAGGKAPKEMYDELSKFSGTRAMVLVVPDDPEAADFSKTIIGTLQQAGWKVSAADCANLFSGVKICAGEDVPIPRDPEAPSPSPIWWAGDALAKLMTAQGLGTHGRFEVAHLGEHDDHWRAIMYKGLNVPAGIVVVEVGARETFHEIHALESWGPTAADPSPLWKLKAK